MSKPHTRCRLDGNLWGKRTSIDCPRLPELISDIIHPSMTIPPMSIGNFSLRALYSEGWSNTGKLPAQSFDNVFLGKRIFFGCGSWYMGRRWWILDGGSEEALGFVGIDAFFSVWWSRGKLRLRIFHGLLHPASARPFLFHIFDLLPSLQRHTSISHSVCCGYCCFYCCCWKCCFHPCGTFCWRGVVAAFCLLVVTYSHSLRTLGAWPEL